MDTLADSALKIGAGIVLAYLARYFEPRIKIVFWQSHNFLYQVPIKQATSPTTQQLATTGTAAVVPAPAPNTVPFLTQSVTIQNVGRKCAEWVEIVHRVRPEFFQLHPSLNYAEDLTPAGEHVIRVQSLAPKEYFSIQFLCTVSAPEGLYIRSSAGYASQVPVVAVRQYPKWMYTAFTVLAVIGTCLSLYWFVRFGRLVLSKLGILWI